MSSINKTFTGVKEASKEYHISSHTILDAVHKRELKAYKPGGRRLSLKIVDIENWIMTKSAN